MRPRAFVSSLHGFHPASVAAAPSPVDAEPAADAPAAAGRFGRSMRRTRWLVVALVMLATACVRRDASPASLAKEPADRAALGMASPPVAGSMARAAASPAAPGALAQSTESFRAARPSQPVDPVSYLAYGYSLRLELPGDHLVRNMDAHAKACRDAGLRVCQLVSSEREGDPDSHLRGVLSLRAEPQWLQRFMTSVEGDARGAGGRITSKSTTTEDLTRAIIDTEATLRAKRALRDRLEQLLATRPGRLSDLLEVERELARVQSEIDSTESNLAAMRTRVMMSALTVQYASSSRAVTSDTFEPLGVALAGFVRYVVDGVAAIVTIVAIALPWAIVGGLAAWLVLRFRRRRNTARASQAPPVAAGEPPSAPPA